MTDWPFGNWANARKAADYGCSGCSEWVIVLYYIVFKIEIVIIILPLTVQKYSKMLCMQKTFQTDLIVT